MNFCLPVSTFSETFGRWLREAASERFGAWVLLFSRFSCFCGPEKNEKKNNTQNQQQRAGKWALALTVCAVVSFVSYTLIILFWVFFPSFEEEMRDEEVGNVMYLRFRVIIFIITNFSSSYALLLLFVRLWKFFLIFIQLRHDIQTSIASADIINYVFTLHNSSWFSLENDASLKTFQNDLEHNSRPDDDGNRNKT